MRAVLVIGAGVLVAVAGTARAEEPAPVDPVTGLTPCDAACLQMFKCTAERRDPTYAFCVRTCDARRTEALAALASASCGDVDTALAAADAPIRRRDCAAILATRKPRRAATGRRDFLASRAWCVSGRGALEAGANGFLLDGNMTSPGSSACWTLEGDRLVWTFDGGRWKSAAVRWPRRDGDPLRVGAQRLQTCPVREIEERPTRTME
jgi:hypothetical protein